VEINDLPACGQFGHDGIVCWDAMGICFGRERAYEDGIGPLVERHHEVLVATSCPDGEASRIIRENLVERDF
jgi:hypothetical protein